MVVTFSVVAAVLFFNCIQVFASFSKLNRMFENCSDSNIYNFSIVSNQEMAMFKNDFDYITNKFGMSRVELGYGQYKATSIPIELLSVGYWLS